MTKLQKYDSSQETAVMIQQQTQAEVDLMVATANRYPRSVEACKQQAITMATSTPEIAESCFYVLERRGKDGQKVFIDGPSIRLAEILASTWGNIRCESKIIEEAEKHVTARSTVWDMERNVLYAQEVRRGIVTSKGRRYGTDMINVTCNAAISLALRNTLFRVVPKSIIDEVYREARKAAQGDTRTIAERRQVLLSSFKKFGIDKEHIEYFLGKSVKDIDEDDLVKMRGVYNVIKDGGMTPDSWIDSIGWHYKDEVDSEEQAEEIMGKVEE